MPILQQFTFGGGVNNEIEPYLLKSSESADLTNANIESGALIPYSDKIAVSDPDIPELTYQNGNRSLVKFGTEYYWSDNSDSTLSSTLGFIGLTPPSTPLDVRLGPVSSLFTGNRKYLYRFLTDEGFRSGPFLIGTNLTTTDVNADQQEAASTQGDYPELNRINIYFYRHRPWYGYKAGSKINFEGDSYRARVDIYEGFPHVPMSDKLMPKVHTGWENINSVTFTESGSESFIITDYDNAIEDQVTFIEIYRTIENGSNYYLTAIVEVGSNSFTDSALDSEIQVNEQITQFNEFPPVYVLFEGQWTRKGGKYLIEINEIFYLAVEDRLFMSKQSDPHLWNPAHNVRFDGDITGIAKLDDSLIVFISDGVPWIVTGTVGDDDLSKLPIPTTQGCPNWKTIAYAKNTPIWQSDDGICAIIRRPLGQGWTVEVLSKGRYVFDTIANFAITYKDSYHLFFDDHCVVFDMGRDTFYRREITAEYGHYNKNDGILYLVENNTFFTLDYGTPQELTHLSAEYAINDLNTLKEADFLSIDADADVTYSVWYDGAKKVDNRTMAIDNKVRSERLPAGTFYRIQIEIKSTAKVRGYNVGWNEV